MHRLSFIEDNIGKLRKSEVKVAEFIPDNAEEVIHFSLSEMAERVGVSEPTVIRFCRALGFSGWQDFKIYLAQAIIPQVRTIHESISEGDPPPQLVSKVCQANINAIQETLQILDYKAVDKATDAMARAGRIVFHGFGGSAVVAMDAHHKFFRTGIRCECISDAHMAVMAASMMHEGQVFLAISHSGASRDIVEVLDVAKNAGATTIAIVSHGRSPVSKVADITLRVASPEVGVRFEPMSSRIAQLCIVDILAVGVALRNKDHFYDNLVKTRRALSLKRF
jgi:DNA-binding MurR/RpiR family transcriptional regulator